MGACFSGDSEKLDYDEVQSYTGETKLGMRHGRGVYLYNNGDTYDGAWEWGKKHGYGTYTRRDQSKLTGYFYKDEYIGTEPGNHFAQVPIMRVGSEARPLHSATSEQHENHRTLSQEEADLMKSKEEMRAERERKRKERSVRREHLRQKYNLIK